MVGLGIKSDADGFLQDRDRVIDVHQILVDPARAESIQVFKVEERNVSDISFVGDSTVWNVVRSGTRAQFEPVLRRLGLDLVAPVAQVVQIFAHAGFVDDHSFCIGGGVTARMVVVNQLLEVGPGIFDGVDDVLFRTVLRADQHGDCTQRVCEWSVLDLRQCDILHHTLQQTLVLANMPPPVFAC